MRISSILVVALTLTNLTMGCGNFQFEEPESPLNLPELNRLQGALPGGEIFALKSPRDFLIVPPTHTPGPVFKLTEELFETINQYLEAINHQLGSYNAPTIYHRPLETWVWGPIPLNQSSAYYTFVLRKIPLDSYDPSRPINFNNVPFDLVYTLLLTADLQKGDVTPILVGGIDLNFEDEGSPVGFIVWDRSLKSKTLVTHTVPSSMEEGRIGFLYQLQKSVTTNGNEATDDYFALFVDQVNLHTGSETSSFEALFGLRSSSHQREAWFQYDGDLPILPHKQGNAKATLKARYTQFDKKAPPGTGRVQIWSSVSPEDSKPNWFECWGYDLNPKTTVSSNDPITTNPPECSDNTDEKSWSTGFIQSNNFPILWMTVIKQLTKDGLEQFVPDSVVTL